MKKNEETLSQWIGNDELDALISQSFEREALLEDVHRQVMSEVRHTTRKETMRHWARLVAFAFGVPFVMLCFGLGIYLGVTRMDMQQPYMWIVIGMSSVALVGFLGREVRNFSISEV